MLEEYNKAYKLGKKDYQARMMKGEKPTLEVLDDILPARGSCSEQKHNPEAMPLLVILCPFCVKIQNLPISGQFLEQVM